MAAARLLRTVRPLHHSFNSSPSEQAARCCSGARWDNRKRGLPEWGMKSEGMVARASTAAQQGAVIPIPRLSPAIHFYSIPLDTISALFRGLTQGLKRRLDASQLQAFIERVIIDCRFLTLFAVAGSLIGSILCFVEGCLLVLQAYLQYARVLSLASKDSLMKLLIESIDMFLVGTSMLTFGTALFTLFLGSRSIRDKSPQLPDSNLYGLFPLQTLPSWAKIDCVLHAKSRIAHAVVMVLHVGILEKFGSIPLATSLDLACFAGAVFVSSVGMFCLSSLFTTRVTVWDASR